MKNEKDRNEKLCLFYVSDYHFEMISLPYISKNLKENKNVVIITEDNLENSIDKVLKNINLPDNEKTKIKEINWNNKSVEKLKKQNNENKNGTLIFIKGEENYIKNINKKIDEQISTYNAKIVDCYDVNTIKDNIGDIVKGYNKILSTSGMEKLI